MSWPFQIADFRNLIFCFNKQTSDRLDLPLHKRSLTNWQFLAFGTLQNYCLVFLGWRWNLDKIYSRFSPPSSWWWGPRQQRQSPVSYFFYYFAFISLGQWFGKNIILIHGLLKIGRPPLLLALIVFAWPSKRWGTLWSEDPSFPIYSSWAFIHQRGEDVINLVYVGLSKVKTAANQ